MAIKQCDEIEEEVQTTTEGGEGTAVSEPSPSQISENVYLGKNLTAVENNIYDDLLNVSDASFFLDPQNMNQPYPIVTTFGNGYIRHNRSSDIADPLRAETRKFFVSDFDNRVVYLNSDFNALGPSATNELSQLYGPSVLTFEYKSITNPSGGDSIFKTFEQDITLKTNQFITNNDSSNALDLNEAWKVFVAGGTDSITGLTRPSALINTDSVFTDHYTKITAPFTPEELERFLNNINNPSYAKVESKYNFFVNGYEDFISSEEVYEYYLQNQFSNITRHGSSYQQDLYKLGAIGGSLKYVQDFINSEVLFSSKFQNIGIPRSSISSLKQMPDTDDLYPMISTIELSTDVTGKLGIASEEAGMTDELLKHVMDQTIIYPDESTGKSSNNGLDFLVATEILAVSEGKVMLQIDNQVRLLPLINLEPWLKNYLEGTPEDTDEDFSALAILLGLETSSSEQSEECNAFANTLKSLILSGKIQNMVDEHFRSYQEVLEGKEAYNETVIYEIKKVVPNVTSNLQRIFVPNTQELDILKYVDTQLKYDKGYKYEIYAHQLIVGTQYSYKSTGERLYTASTNEYSTNCTVTYKPSLQIARIPIFTQDTRVLDNAPVFPNVDIVPFKGVNNRVLINLNGNVGNYELQPVIINEADAAFAEKYRSERGLSSSDPITFQSDDPVTHFEIYRMSIPPKSYTDFSNSLLTTATTPGATSTSFIDSIEPNTKYYYTFRAVDVHENRSNPTEIYMIELVEFQGMIFFNQSIYEIGSETYNNVKVTRDFRRYFKINPSLIQSLVSEDSLLFSSAHEATDVNLGRAAESVWDKKFKIRITSKNSGKKFDINLNCKVNFIKDTSQPEASTNTSERPDGYTEHTPTESQGTTLGDLKADIYKSRGEALASESAFNTVADSLSVLNQNKAITTYVPDTVQAQIDSFIADIKTGDFTEDLAMDIRNTFLGVQSNGSISGYDMELLGEAIDGITNIVESKFGSTAMNNNMMQNFVVKKY